MLLDTVDRIIGATMEEMGVPANQEVNFQNAALDYVRAMQKDVKTLIPDRDKEIFYPLPNKGYNVIRLPGDYYEYITVGTQIGNYIKALAINNKITEHKKQPLSLPLIQTTPDSIWYFGGLYGYGLGWGTSGPVNSFGNGNDYGDVTIDIDRRVLITAPNFRYPNLVLKYYTTCLTPSLETCIHPWFIMALKHWLAYRHYFFKNDSRWQISKMEYEKDYLFALQSKYREKIPTIVKAVERTRGYRHT
jgi:hypothetical protein